MNPEVFAEWLRMQGHRVIRTESSYWYNQGPRALQAFPYQWLIEPDEEELTQLLKKEKAIALKFSTPISAPEGCISYHMVYDKPSYDSLDVHKKSRSSVRAGLRTSHVGPMSFEQFEAEGWRMRQDTLKRQVRRTHDTEKSWRRMVRAASTLEGFETWGAEVDGELAACLMLVRVDDCINILLQQSVTRDLHLHVNNALTFVVTQNLVQRPNVRLIHYGLHSLDAPPSVDQFKVNMGFVPMPIRQRVCFHPWTPPGVAQAIHFTLDTVLPHRPQNSSFAKATGIFRIYVQGKMPLSGQEFPEVLKSERKKKTDERSHDPLIPFTSVRKATNRDLAGMVRVHRSGFEGFFLSLLGNNFLELMYREILHEPGNVSLVAVSENNDVVGFVVGVGNQVEFYRRLVRQRWFAFAAAAFNGAMFHPRIIPRLVRALRYPAFASHRSCPGLLMSVAVDPSVQGKGLGKILIERFLDEMARSGVSKICLTTDRDNNIVVNECYVGRGFLKATEFQTAEGRWMNEYIIQTTNHDKTLELHQPLPQIESLMQR